MFEPLDTGITGRPGGELGTNCSAGTFFSERDDSAKWWVHGMGQGAFHLFWCYERRYEMIFSTCLYMICYYYHLCVEQMNSWTPRSLDYIVYHIRYLFIHIILRLMSILYIHYPHISISSHIHIRLLPGIGPALLFLDSVGTRPGRQRDEIDSGLKVHENSCVFMGI